MASRKSFQPRKKNKVKIPVYSMSCTEEDLQKILDPDPEAPKHRSLSFKYPNASVDLVVWDLPPTD